MRPSRSATTPQIEGWAMNAPTSCPLERREVAFEAVVVVDAAEGLVDDAGALLGVGRLNRAELDRDVAFGRDGFGDRSHSSLLAPR
jgi:hypothetical protein